MSERRKNYVIELVYFDGCPNVEQARANLRAVVGESSWTEWNLSSADTPDRFRRYGSPTVLVDGHDVTDGNGNEQTMACRTDGAPGPEVIERAVAAS